MARFREQNPRGRYGGVIYRPDDLGLDADAVASSLRAYHNRFVAN